MTELSHSLTHIGVTDATFKLRVSGGLRVQKYIGRGSYDPLIDQGSIAGMDKDTTMCFTLTHAGTVLISLLLEILFSLLTI